MKTSSEPSMARAIEVVRTECGNRNRGDSLTTIQDLLSEYPKVEAVGALDAEMVVRELAAVKAAGRSDIKLVLGGA